jgi:heme/copper-type cytochrome/quinol oxidase subunit 2
MSEQPDTTSQGQQTSVERQASERLGWQLTVLLFGGILAVAAVAVAVSAIALSSKTSTPQTAALAGSPHNAAATQVPASEKLWVAPSWKMGSDGERHDAYSKTNFTVKVGQPLRLTIDNRDDTMHSITAAAAGVNIVIKPGVHTYTLRVTHAGQFKWICAYPCDPFAMDRPGYMGGYITAV